MPCVTAISIRLKVILAFAVVLCCTIGVGAFTLQRLYGVNRAAAGIRDTELPATRILGEPAYHTMRFRQLDGRGAGLALVRASEMRYARSKPPCTRMLTRMLSERLRVPDMTWLHSPDFQQFLTSAETAIRVGASPRPFPVSGRPAFNGKAGRLRPRAAPRRTGRSARAFAAIQPLHCNA